MTDQVLLLAAAAVFAFVNGVNDGGALLSIGLSVRTVRPLVGLVLLATAVVVAPVLFGTAVATTLATRLVGFEGDDGRAALLVAVAASIAVTLLLARRGLPTSLTLGLVGAMAGVGAGAGIPVAWTLVVVVLLAAAAAPLLGLAMGRALTLLAARLPARKVLLLRVRRWHTIGFLLLCIAYGTNDGQKMLAVFAIAASPVVGQVDLVAWQLAAVAACFFVGAAVGLPRFALTLGSGVLPIRPTEAATTELSAGAVVLATGVAGAPVSMTQAASGALVGAGVGRGYGAIRWDAAARIGGAWAVTLPCAFVVAAVAAYLLPTS